MQYAASHAARPNGLRRLSPAMLAIRDRADTFEGLPEGTAHPYHFLAAFQEAEPYLRLPKQAYRLMAYLFSLTRPCDWEEGSRPIVWPSARAQQEHLGLSAAQVKLLNRALFEAGLFVIRDNAEGKRYGQRGPDGRILVAFGFDLSPMALRHEEFKRIAAEGRMASHMMKSLRRQISIIRRAINQAEDLVRRQEESVPELEAWLKERDQLSDRARYARSIEVLQDVRVRLLAVCEGVEGLVEQEQETSIDGQMSSKTSPAGPENRPHIEYNTTLRFHPSDTVIAHQKSSRAERNISSLFNPQGRVEKDRAGGIRAPAELLELAPRLAQYVGSADPDWSELVGAAGGALRHELNVSTTLWAQACRVMGREGATLALAIVSTKPEDYFSSGPGGYFGGMVKKAEKGELFLERSLWALREAKWGKRPWVQ